ncbi:response regulator transcription factor [Caldalkalibacillus salinus]|uniref:response regulator transcription factor n=1 Tax=Caldalkalibacillus salinus TaxID=2803787 RepID=UPI001920F23A|nr:response regulator transcription factor [Caldalkalibacillus salinus]
MKTSIALVDDHAVVLEGMGLIIDLEEDLEVVGKATNGIEAVTLIERTKPDVVLMDINMPEMDGVEATKRIKSISPESEILILTMYDKDEYLFSVLRSGASGYLLKDCPSEEVVDAIRVVANGQSMLHPAMAKKLLNQYAMQAEEETSGSLGSHVHHSNEQPAESPPPSQFEPLSPREAEVLRLLVEGKTNKDIAEVLFISEKTVKIHLNKVYKKLKVKSRSQAIICAIQYKVLETSTPSS